MVSMVKRFSSVAARGAALSRLLDLLEWAERPCAGILRVLTYHRIADPDAEPALGSRLISATPAAFERQMASLAARYRVVSMQHVLDARRRGRSMPSGAVLVTFDDAYEDFAAHAWPIMKRYGLPATLFVATSFPGRKDRVFWWDRLHQALYATARRDELDTPLGPLSLATATRRARVYNRLVDCAKTLSHHAAIDLVDRICEKLDAPPPRNHVLGWDALRRLADEGVTLGAHSRTHPLMNRIRVVEAAAEAAGSYRDLCDEIGSALPIFAYPAGGVNDRVAAALKREGFVLGFTTQCGINDLRVADPLQLRRIHVGQRTTVPVLRTRLLAMLNRRIHHGGTENTEFFER